MDFIQIIGERLSESLNININYILENIKKIEFGVYSFPCFILKSEGKQDFALIAEGIKNEIIFNDIGEVKVWGPYLNFYISRKNIIKKLLESICEEDNKYWKSIKSEGKCIVINNLYSDIESHKVNTSLITLIISRVFILLGYSVCIGNTQCLDDSSVEWLVKLLNNKNLLVNDSGAIGVNLEKYNLPPYLVYKEGKIIADKELLKLIESHNRKKYDKTINIIEGANKTKYNKILAVAEILGYEIGQCIVTKDTSLLEIALFQVKNIHFKLNEIIKSYDGMEIQDSILEVEDNIELIKKIEDFTQMITQVIDELNVNILAEYILSLTKNIERICEKENISQDSFEILKVSEIVVKKCLYLLGMDII